MSKPHRASCRYVQMDPTTATRFAAATVTNHSKSTSDSGMRFEHAGFKTYPTVKSQFYDITSWADIPVSILMHMKSLLSFDYGLVTRTWSHGSASLLCVYVWVCLMYVLGSSWKISCDLSELSRLLLYFWFMYGYYWQIINTIFTCTVSSVKILECK